MVWGGCLLLPLESEMESEGYMTMGQLPMAAVANLSGLTFSHPYIQLDPSSFYSLMFLFYFIF